MNENEHRTKRLRTPNYNAEEKNLLLNIIHNKFKNIIENKKTDAVTSKEKDAAWKEISTIFNSQTPTLVLRSWQSLKKCYNNLKKNTRKAVADEKLQLIKTGGGASVLPSRDPNQELTLGLLNTKTVHGLDNPFDIDTVNLNNGTIIETEDENDYEQENIEQHPVAPDIPGTNQTCVTPGTSKTSWTRRRRPVLTTATSNDLTSKYIKLAEIKTEFTQHSINCLLKDEQRKEEEAALKIKLLEVELAIKEAELKNIIKNS